MKVKELFEKMQDLIDKGCEDYDVETMYKNCSHISEIDRENKTVTLS